MSPPLTAISASNTTNQADGIPGTCSQIDHSQCRWNWRDEELVLLAHKAIWRPSGRELFIADLHLGKAEVFQACGIPLPSDGDRGTFERLEWLCEHVQPRRLIILGDLIHGRLGLTQRLQNDLNSLHQRLNTDVLLIGGNHDRGLHLAGMPQRSSFRLGDLWLSHEPEAPSDGREGLNLCGHIHPSTTLRQGADRLRLPCFAYDSSVCRMLIPAFGELTGGHHCGHRYRKWLVAEGTIVPWLDPAPPSRTPKPER